MKRSEISVGPIEPAVTWGKWNYSPIHAASAARDPLVIGALGPWDEYILGRRGCPDRHAAPKGLCNIAPGNARGPAERATQLEVVSRQGRRPFRAFLVRGSGSQGVALGYAA